MCQRRIDLEGLPGLALCRLLRHVTPRSGVVQTVSQLDHQHPDVACHGHDHLADGLGLGGLPVGHLVQLGHTVDEHRDLVTEVIGKGLEAV